MGTITRSEADRRIFAPSVIFPKNTNAERVLGYEPRAEDVELVAGVGRGCSAPALI